MLDLFPLVVCEKVISRPIVWEFSGEWNGFSANGASCGRFCPVAMVYDLDGIPRFLGAFLRAKLKGRLSFGN